MRLAAALAVFAAGVTAAITHHPRPVPAVGLSAPDPQPARASRDELRKPLAPNVNASTDGEGATPRRKRAPARSGPSRPAFGGQRLHWDALADCESSGDWHANTGNGFYGGLQFDAETWRSVGGHGLPSAASRTEQIARALILFRSRGTQPWPVCGWRLVAP